MKYIRTKDGRIIDVGKFIKGEKENPNYSDFSDFRLKTKAIVVLLNGVQSAPITTAL